MEIHLATDDPRETEVYRTQQRCSRGQLKQLLRPEQEGYGEAIEVHKHMQEERKRVNSLLNPLKKDKRETYSGNIRDI
jgi:hypothetical protein